LDCVAESWIEPFENPTVTMPSPLRDSTLRFIADDEFCVVLPSANSEARTLASATLPFVFVNEPTALSLKPRVWKADEPPAAENAWLLCDVRALWLAVIAEPALVPKLIPLAFERESV